ncbi:putative carbonic anhydrase [Operophtera brumata]|uniref:Putative carbonic anhydrase n=1 Tax=Operophtera brumata TaxID=104452 RepID=A0A0L7KZN0_OPEBR|nr:putative carbonic anhydrase [Operophtera brumata]
MNVPIQISDVQYKEFSRANVGGIDNYRSLQPVNRVVYRSAASCSTIILPGLLGTFTALLNCLSSSLNSGLLVGAKKSLCVLWNAKKKFIRGPRNIHECQD